MHCVQYICLYLLCILYIIYAMFVCLFTYSILKFQSIDAGNGRGDDLICCKGTIPVRYKGIKVLMYVDLLLKNYINSYCSNDMVV